MWSCCRMWRIIWLNLLDRGQVGWIQQADPPDRAVGPRSALPAALRGVGCTGRPLAAVLAARVLGGALAGAAVVSVLIARCLWRPSMPTPRGRARCCAPRRLRLVDVLLAAHGHDSMQVGLHREPTRTEQIHRRRPVQRIAVRAPAGATREQRPVILHLHHSEAALRARVVFGDEPIEGKLRGAERALGLLQAADADAVEVVLARGRHHRLHQQRLRAQGAVHGAVQRERIACGGQLQPLQLLRRAQLLLLLQPLLRGLARQGVEKVGGRCAAAAATTAGLLVITKKGALARPWQGGICHQRPHELADDIAHLALGLLALLTESLLGGVLGVGLAKSLLREVSVQEAREQTLRARDADTATGVAVANSRGLLWHRLGSADGALRHPVLPRLEGDRPQDEALPAEAMVAGEFDHVGDGVQADRALLRLLLLLQLRPLRGAVQGHQLGQDEHVPQRLHGRVQLREVRAAEEALAREPSCPLRSRVLQAKVGLFPPLFKDLDHTDSIPDRVLP
mmetsp:Transcript_32656/g.74345  ORF Transcript_32656/g.74345 Transcript_32656/m.74345 type:complete len:510 (+) Transcript_32656:226-1755(+)